MVIQWKFKRMTSQEIIEHNKNKQCQSEEQALQEILVEQERKSAQQYETYHVSSFKENDKILMRKGEIEIPSQEEKELLMRVVKKIRFDPDNNSSNLRSIDRKKIVAATVKTSEIVSLIKTETITERNSVEHAACNICEQIVGYKNKVVTGNRPPNWQRRILKKQKTLYKVLRQ